MRPICPLLRLSRLKLALSPKKCYSSRSGHFLLGEILYALEAA
jgi:hypothetical protein